MKITRKQLKDILKISLNLSEGALTKRQLNQKRLAINLKELKGRIIDAFQKPYELEDFRDFVIVNTDSEGPVAFYKSSGLSSSNDVLHEVMADFYLPWCGHTYDPAKAGLGMANIRVGKMLSNHPQASRGKFPKEDSEFYAIGRGLAILDSKGEIPFRDIKNLHHPSLPTTDEFSRQYDLFSEVAYEKDNEQFPTDQTMSSHERQQQSKRKFEYIKNHRGDLGKSFSRRNYANIVINMILGKRGALKNGPGWEGSVLDFIGAEGLKTYKGDPVPSIKMIKDYYARDPKLGIAVMFRDIYTRKI